MVTTNTDENAIAAPASIGLSRPEAASGNAATYERGIPAGLATRLERILQNIELHMNAGDWLALAREDLQFHETIVEAAQSPRLSHIFSTLAGETLLCLSAFDKRYIRPPTAVEQHQRLLDRLIGGDLAESLAEIDRLRTAR